MNDSSEIYDSPKSNIDQKEVNPEIFKSWLLFFIVATVGGFLAGAVVGGIVGAIMGASGVPIQTITLAGQVVGFVVGIPVSYFSFRWSVTKYILGAV